MMLVSRNLNILRFYQKVFYSFKANRNFCSRNLIPFQSFPKKQIAFSQITVRGFKNARPAKSRPLKVKKAASKRLIKTANGLKRGHAGKSHLNITKSKTRLNRLKKSSHIEGTWLKNMKKLLCI